MLVAVLVGTWCLALVLTAGLGRIESYFTPAWQVRFLGIGALALGITTVTSVLAAVCVAGQRYGVSLPAQSAALGVGLVLCAWQPVRHGVRMVRCRRAAAPFRDFADRRDRVVVLDDPIPEAFAVPGRGGVVVVTTGLRDALALREFGAVLRHEFAHLRFRHHLYIQLVELAAGANPLLRRWCGAVRFAAERQADEWAARSGRDVAARALAKVAVLSASTGAAASPRMGIGGDAEAVVRRVRALRAPGPPRQQLVPVAAAVLALLLVFADLELAADVIQDRIAPETGEVVLFGP